MWINTKALLSMNLTLNLFLSKSTPCSSIRLVYYIDLDDLMLLQDNSKYNILIPRISQLDVSLCTNHFFMPHHPPVFEWLPPKPQTWSTWFRLNTSAVIQASTISPFFSVYDDQAPARTRTKTAAKFQDLSKTSVLLVTENASIT